MNDTSQKLAMPHLSAAVSSSAEAILLVATDGTPQSDAAISVARRLAGPGDYSVRVVAVVEHASMPWGTVEGSLVLQYERGEREEARKRMTAQVTRLGDPDWPAEVKAGDPAVTIAALAHETQARMIIVGLGGHGVAARLFGNETALRLVRTCQTPVLAVDAKTTTVPSEILVAMDFSESSIEAARLALELAPGARMTLVHVVPWQRTEYVPEHWFNEHEAYIAGQLKRVSRWLEHDGASRIHHRILYGKPGPALLACAEDLRADLIVAGTHGRNFLGRILGGETVSKLIRGARCSVLMVPHAATFQRFLRSSREAKLRTNVAAATELAHWVTRLDDFSRRNGGRRGRLEIDDTSVGAQVEMKGYRFLGAAYDIPTRRAQLMFGSMKGTEPHLVRGISNVKSIEILSDRQDQTDKALSIVNDDGQTLLLLDEITRRNDV